MSARPFVTAGYRNKRTAGFLGIETKFFDTAASSALVNPSDAAGGEVDPTTLETLFAPTKGSGEENRDGKKAVMKSVFISGTVSTASQTNQTVPENPPLIFIALVLDKQSNAATLASEDVFTNKSGSSGRATAVMRNMLNSSRFRVLKTWRMTFPAPQLTWDGTNMEQAGAIQHFQHYMKLNIPVLFKANAGSIADVVDNSLHVIGYASTTEGAATLSYNARVTFVG